jgi:ATP-binding cassette, subfamily B, bacterial MsbA
MNQDLRLYLRLLSFAKPYWKLGLGSILAMVATAGLEPLLPALMKPLIDESLIAKDPESLWQIPLLLVVVFVAKGIADYLATVSSQTLAHRTMADLRQAVFEHQLALPMSVHQTEEPGRMLSRITYDITMVSDAVASAWLILIRDTLILIALLSFLFYTAWPLTLLVIAMAPLVAVVIKRAGKRLRRSNHQLQGFMARINGMVEEAMLGLRDIKIFQGNKHQAERFSEQNRLLRAEQIKVTRVQAMNVPLVQVIAACSVALVIYVASKMAASNSLSPGEFVSFIAAMSMVFEPVRRLTNVNNLLQRGLAAAESLFGLLDRPPEPSGETPAAPPTAPSSPTAPTAMPLSAATSSLSSGAASPRLSGRITMQSISYQYPFQDKPALENFSLSIEPNEVVALVGPSGAGKSTVLYLLAGFDSPGQGQILFDGEPLQETNLLQLRQNIALVSQRVTLFNETIAENIAMGRPGADRASIEQAARAAHAWEFIQKLPEGLDTPLGSLGDRLSGGQRQRIAIARAFLKDAPILLLDEATSALDKESEQAVLQGLQSLIVNRTVILVSHAPERLMPGLRRVDIAVSNR